MDGQDLGSVWARTLTALSESDLSPSYRAWLPMVRPLALVEGTALLAAPNEFAKDALETRLRNLITQALSHELGREIRVAVTVQPEPPAAPAAGPGPRPGEPLSAPVPGREAVPGRRRARPLSPTPTGSGRRTRGTGIATAPTRISLTGNSSTATPPTPTPRAGAFRSSPSERPYGEPYGDQPYGDQGYRSQPGGAHGHATPGSYPQAQDDERRDVPPAPRPPAYGAGPGGRGPTPFEGRSPQGYAGYGGQEGFGGEPSGRPPRSHLHDRTLGPLRPGGGRSEDQGHEPQHGGSEPQRGPADDTFPGADPRRSLAASSTVRAIRTGRWRAAIPRGRAL